MTHEETKNSVNNMETNETQAPQYILKLPNKSKYVTRLKKMVTARKGKLDDYVEGHIDRTAYLWRRIDKLEAEMEKMPTIIQDIGSAGQVKCTANPIYPIYINLNRTLSIYFKALGLNYDISPEKIIEADTDNENDPLAKMLNG